MKGKGFLAKKQQRRLLVPVFFLVFLMAGCQPDSYVENTSAETDIPEDTLEETSGYYYSNTSKEDCLKRQEPRCLCTVGRKILELSI